MCSDVVALGQICEVFSKTLTFVINTFINDPEKRTEAKTASIEMMLKLKDEIHAKSGENDINSLLVNFIKCL